MTTSKLSLSPLNFDEALTDILKIKPEPKQKADNPNPKREPPRKSKRRKNQGR